MYPDQFFSLIKNRIKKEWLFAFGSTFFTGLIIHLFRLTNHLLTWDSVYNFHDSQNIIHLGRCFLTLSCGISSYYDLQWINGLLSLLYLSLTCVCLTELFSLQKRVSIFLISALTVSFPTVASTFAYMYTADGYFLAMLFVTMAVLFTIRFQKGWIGGLFLIAAAYGSYQAYISYAIMLILTWTVLHLLFAEDSVRDMFRYWGHLMLMGGLGTVLYLICNKALSVIEGVTASDYNGISTMSLPDGSRLIQAVRDCIIDFVYFFFGPLDTMNLYKILNSALFLLLAVLLLRLILHSKIYRSPGRFVMMLFSFAAMPFVCSIIYFLSPEVRYYMLMYAGFSLIYMLPVLLYDRSSAPAFSPSVSWLCVLLSAVTIFNFALISNISYLYMKASNEMTFALTNRMVDRIEQLEDYDAVEKLCVIGHFKDYDRISLNLPPAMAGIRNSYFISEQAHFAAMMDTYFGVKLESCSDEERTEIRNSDTFRQMGCWPASDSVIQSGDTVIIKIASEQCVEEN